MPRYNKSPDILAANDVQEKQGRTAGNLKWGRYNTGGVYTRVGTFDWMRRHFVGPDLFVLD